MARLEQLFSTGGDGSGVTEMAGLPAAYKVVPPPGYVYELHRLNLVMEDATKFSGDPSKENIATLIKLADKSYDKIKSDHIQDYRSLFRRVSLDVGTSDRAKLPSPDRLKQFDEGDPQLVELFLIDCL